MKSQIDPALPLLKRARTRFRQCEGEMVQLIQEVGLAGLTPAELRPARRAAVRRLAAARVRYRAAPSELNRAVYVSLKTRTYFLTLAVAADECRRMFKAAAAKVVDRPDRFMELGERAVSKWLHFSRLYGSLAQSAVICSGSASVDRL